MILETKPSDRTSHSLINPHRFAAFGTLFLGLALALASSCQREPSSVPKGHDHSAQTTPEQSVGTDSDETYYTCPMHPSVRSHVPGQCPICGMNLVAVTRGSEGAEVSIDSVRAQKIGVKTAPVERVDLHREIRTVGRVAYDETRLADVTLKYGGFVEELFANAPGIFVRKGAPLFTLYSPELFAAQQELLAALASRRVAAGTGASDRADYLVDAARARLRLWDLTDAQVAAIIAANSALRYVPIPSPAEGYVVEKNVVAGSSVEPGARLFRIADMTRVWIEADVYERDFGAIHTGDMANVSVSHLDGRTIRARVDFVYPWLDDVTRSGRVRLLVENPDTDLKPDMYVDVTFSIDQGPGLAIPENAVLYAGDARYVFVETGAGRFRPQSVKIGTPSGGIVPVREGLMEGDRIVVSGTFLIAAESRLKVALEDWK